MDYLQEAINGYDHAEEASFTQAAALISIAQSLAALAGFLQAAEPDRPEKTKKIKLDDIPPGVSVPLSQIADLP